MNEWLTWAVGVLRGIGAQPTDTNLDSLWNWSYKESGSDVMRWNNPLNTTMPWAGSVDMNSVHVKKYLTVQDGIDATRATLLNGLYKTIVANLRASIPHQQWTNAAHELDEWGTHTNWLNWDYHAPLLVRRGKKMSEDELIALGHAISLLCYGQPMPAKRQDDLVNTWRAGALNLGDTFKGWYADGQKQGKAYSR